MEKLGTSRVGWLRVMSRSVMSRFTVTGVAEVGISRPFPSNLNFAMGILGGFGSSEVVVVVVLVVNETWAFRASSQVWRVREGAVWAEVVELWQSNLMSNFCHAPKEVGMQIAS